MPQSELRQPFRRLQGGDPVLDGAGCKSAGRHGNLRSGSRFRRQQPPAFFEACKDDISSLCKNVQPGEGRMKQCLNQNSGSLSAGCKAAIPSSTAQAAKAPAGSGNLRFGSRFRSHATAAVL